MDGFTDATEVNSLNLDIISVNMWTYFLMQTLVFKLGKPVCNATKIEI